MTHCSLEVYSAMLVWSHHWISVFSDDLWINEFRHSMRTCHTLTILPRLILGCLYSIIKVNLRSERMLLLCEHLNVIFYLCTWRIMTWKAQSWNTVLVTLLEKVFKVLLKVLVCIVRTLVILKDYLGCTIVFLTLKTHHFCFMRSCPRLNDRIEPLKVYSRLIFLGCCWRSAYLSHTLL